VLKFVSAALWVDKGVKHTKKVRVRSKTKTDTTYTANATLRRASESFTLSLKGLSRGTHTLKLIVTYKETVRRQTKRVTKTLSVRFSVA
jgi:hypothetical protein